MTNLLLSTTRLKLDDWYIVKVIFVLYILGRQDTAVNLVFVGGLIVINFRACVCIDC